MGKKLIIILIYSNLLFVSCNKLFYENPMPQESEIVDDIPSSFLGEYLEIYFEEYAVVGYFKTISEISNKRYLIEDTKVIFLDSLEWSKKRMSPVKMVNVENTYLEIITENNIYKKGFADTLSSERKRKVYELDLKEGVFYDAFDSKEEHESSKRECQLRLKNEKYYLSIKYFDKYWMISRIIRNEKSLILNTTNFSLQDENEVKFDHLKSKYGFEKIKFEGERGTDWAYYLANTDNDEMEKILNEAFFDGVLWHRINEKSTNWISISIGLIILIITYVSLIFVLEKNA